MTLKTEAGKAIRQARKEKKITIRELSEKSKVEFFHLGRIERGITNTSLDTIDRLAAVLDKTAKLNLE